MTYEHLKKRKYGKGLGIDMIPAEVLNLMDMSRQNIIYTKNMKNLLEAYRVDNFNGNNPIKKASCHNYSS